MTTDQIVTIITTAVAGVAAVLGIIGGLLKWQVTRMMGSVDIQVDRAIAASNEAVTRLITEGEAHVSRMTGHMQDVNGRLFELLDKIAQMEQRQLALESKTCHDCPKRARRD